MERLTGLDASFLYFENPNMHMHVSMVSVFDTQTMAGGYRFEAVQALIESRLSMIPTFRRRLVHVPFNLHHPVWIEDPDFDLDYHVTRVAVPSPGTIKELCDLAGAFVSRPLDRSRPLWEMQVVEGVADGRIALLCKVHHSMIDGVSGAEMMVHIFDLTPEPPTIVAPPKRQAERVPSDIELVGYAARSIARQPANLVRTIRGTAKTVTDFVSARRGHEGPGMPAPFTAPRTNFNGALTPHRSVAVANLTLDDLKRIKNAFGVTLNDVVLALVSDALRRYLDGRGEMPDKSLIAVCPISVRSESGAEGSNAVSAMFVTLASHIDDPIERLAAIHETTKGAKTEHKAIGADMLQDLAQFAPAGLVARASRMYSSMRLAERHRPIHNLVISNVPGPPIPLYLAGARLEMLCPLGPVMEGAGLNITVLSNQGAVDVGLIACKELMPDLWDLADDFVDAAADLLKVAEAHVASGGGPLRSPDYGAASGGGADAKPNAAARITRQANDALQTAEALVGTAATRAAEAGEAMIESTSASVSEMFDKAVIRAEAVIDNAGAVAELAVAIAEERIEQLSDRIADAVTSAASHAPGPVAEVVGMATEASRQGTQASIRSAGVNAERMASSARKAIRNATPAPAKAAPSARIAPAKAAPAKTASVTAASAKAASSAKTPSAKAAPAKTGKVVAAPKGDPSSISSAVGSTKKALSTAKKAAKRTASVKKPAGGS